jgi:hypothetical protein
MNGDLGDLGDQVPYPPPAIQIGVDFSNRLSFGAGFRGFSFASPQTPRFT